MTDSAFSLGIIGGTGMLGSAIVHALMAGEAIAPDRLWVSNRSGVGDAALREAGVHFVADNQALIEECEIILICVPPAAFVGTSMDASNRLIVSVMAGVNLETLTARTGSQRVIRAMSSPAAKLGLAYSPWMASPSVSATDRARVRALFEACGTTDEVFEEGHLDIFTAMTGPVPGFVAYFADCMAKYAGNHGIDADVADRAVRQLFLGAGAIMAGGSATPSDHVQEMVDYAGTTAAGLVAMSETSIAEDIAHGLDAAVSRTRSIAGDG